MNHNPNSFQISRIHYPQDSKAEDSDSRFEIITLQQRRHEPQSNGREGANFENLPARIGVRIRRMRCEWWQLEAARKGDRNYLAVRANVFFMTVKNLQKFGFSIFQYFLLQFAPNEDANLFL